MTLFIQDYPTEEVLFQTTDFSVIPNKGEALMLDGKWYTVVQRTFYFKHLTIIDDNSCSLFVKLNKED